MTDKVLLEDLTELVEEHGVKALVVVQEMLLREGADHPDHKHLYQATFLVIGILSGLLTEREDTLGAIMDTFATIAADVAAMRERLDALEDRPRVMRS